MNFGQRIPFNSSLKPPTRDELLSVGISFQGLVVDTDQYGTLPGFEACLPWLSDSDRDKYFNVKLASGRDTHVILGLPHGDVLYNEPNQPYSPDRFGPLDWTNNSTSVSSEFNKLVHQALSKGFNKFLLFLDGDGAGNLPLALKQLDLLYANDEFRNTLYKYCIVIPGWDSVFYGWDPSEVVTFGKAYRKYWPDGYLGLEHDEGHIPLGEGGDDFRPGGRLQDFDLILSEYDFNTHQDQAWQINARLEKPYFRPPDQPANDDPNPPFYLGVDNPRGPWYHLAFEFGEYEFVHFGLQNLPDAVSKVEANRLYLKSMGCKFVG